MAGQKAGLRSFPDVERHPDAHSALAIEHLQLTATLLLLLLDLHLPATPHCNAPGLSCHARGWV